MTSLGAVFLATVYGCATPGSDVSSGGSTGTNSGGVVGATGGSGMASGGVNGSGTGGSDPSGTGGSTSGSGGDVGSGSGGVSGPGTGGSSTGTGGVSGPGTGGNSTASGGRVGTGGSSTGTGGIQAPGTGGRVGTGGVVGTGGAIGTGGVTASACPKPAGQICHEFYAADNYANRLLYVNEFDPTKNWVVPVMDTTEHSPRTIEIVDNPMATGGKAILVSTNRGFGEYDIGNKGANLFRVLNQVAPVSGAARIPNPADPTMAQTALGTLASITIVTKTGTRVSSFPLPNGTDELRVINRNPADGSYWFSKLDDIFQVSATGAMLWTANLGAGAKGYAVWWRAGGGAYATTGDPSSVVEFDINKVRQVPLVGTRVTFPELNFVSGFVRLPNGNFVVANWLGHLADNDPSLAGRPHIVELTPANAMVWKWGTQALARRITNVNVIR